MSSSCEGIYIWSSSHGFSGFVFNMNNLYIRRNVGRGRYFGDVSLKRIFFVYECKEAPSSWSIWYPLLDASRKCMCVVKD